MSKFVTVSSIFLAWAFFEKSGGFDFVPASERETASSEEKASTSDQLEFAEVYVPFQKPVIVPAGSQFVGAGPNAGIVTEITPASFDSTTDTATVQQAALRSDQVSDDTNADIRIISGDWVNVRQGPGTEHAVVQTLPRGTEAEVLDLTGDWAQIRLLKDESVVWVASWLLSD